MSLCFQLGAVRKLRKGVLSLSWTTHPPSYVVESKGFTKQGLTTHLPLHPYVIYERPLNC